MPHTKRILCLIAFAAAALSGRAQTTIAPEPVHLKQPRMLKISYAGYPIYLKDFLVPGKTTIFNFYSHYSPTNEALHQDKPHNQRFGAMLLKLHKGRDDVAVVMIDINRPNVIGVDWQSPLLKEFSIHILPHLEIYNPDGSFNCKGSDALVLVEKWTLAIDPHYHE